VFYAAWDWRFLALLFVSTVIGYTSGIALAGATGERKRKAILVSRIAMNLGMLAVFKYANFFADSFAEVLRGIGLHASAPTLQIILPIAISYYTFEEISYAVDIYRRDIGPCRDPIDYALFVAFFPKLVAGPILRPRQLIPQIQTPRVRPDRERIASALGLLLWGLVKKVVIADSLAGFVDQIYADPAAQSAVGLIVGTLCFAGQIYGDFSGYSDMARGASRLLGFELPLNFRQPYLSNSLTAFWRTWHISLSTWLRDYLYIPLGGNQHGVRRTAINLMIVMLLGGLWHGAGWTFLIWGGIHGSILIIERVINTTADNSNTVPTLAQLPRIAVTFAVVCVAWIFFRARSFATAGEIIGRIVTLQRGDVVWDAVIWLAIAATVLVIADLIERRAQTDPTNTIRIDPLRIGILIGVSAVALVITSGGTPVPFIYFQF
jgi:D-alanyl-lipoteichoic acid acyltransferase DltB (MBOAT superfamily)